MFRRLQQNIFRAFAADGAVNTVFRRGHGTIDHKNVRLLIQLMQCVFRRLPRRGHDQLVIVYGQQIQHGIFNGSTARAQHRFHATGAFLQLQPRDIGFGHVSQPFSDEIGAFLQFLRRRSRGALGGTKGEHRRQTTAEFHKISSRYSPPLKVVAQGLTLPAST